MLPNYVTNNIGLSLAVAIVVIGLLVIGLGDVARFSWTRVWAISGVNYTQSLRRRVLWITPLVIVGVIVVSQFQKAVDPQDAIRQTTMFCLFATGMLVVTVTVILACTNLPREIDSRVIYTVATKPTTRLEIVLGKIVGFVRVSFWLLVIMGVFTYGYVKFRDWRMRSYLAAQLDTPGTVEQVNRPTLEYYRDYGTLHARVLDRPQDLTILADMPRAGEPLWAPGFAEGEIFANFRIDRSLIPLPDPADASADPSVGPAPVAPKGGLILRVGVRVERHDEPWLNLNPELPTTAPAETGVAGPTTGPATAPASAAAPAATQPAAQQPRVAIFVNNEQREILINSTELGGAVDGWDVNEGVTRMQFFITPDLVARAIPPNASQSRISVSIVGQTHGWKYTSDAAEVALIVPETGHMFRPEGRLEFTGRMGIYGRQLRGGRDAKRVAIYRFDGVEPGSAGRDGKYQFELRLGVERLEEGESTKIAVHFHDQKTRTHSTEMFVETNRPNYLNVPASAVEGDMFWVVIQSQTNAWLGLMEGPRASLRLVRQDQSFAWNLLKSLTVLWLLSMLVTAVSVFSSTFLSWPIAVVLTVMILSGRWAAEMIGAAEGSVGRQVVTEMFGREAGAAGARAVSESVDALVTMLHTISQVLPDLSQFRAIEDLEQGIAISPQAVLLPSLLVTLGFGIPLMVLGYVFLKFKEVAP